MRRVVASIRIMPDILEKLQQLADATGRRTRNQLVEDILDAYVRRHWTPDLAQRQQEQRGVRKR